MSGREKPWSSNSIEEGNDKRDVNSTPLGYFHFMNQNCCRQNNTIKHKCDNMTYDLSNKEKAVDHVKLLPHRHFLQCIVKQIVISREIV
jgi:hypothetical protein